MEPNVQCGRRAGQTKKEGDGHDGRFNHIDAHPPPPPDQAPGNAFTSKGWHGPWDFKASIVKREELICQETIHHLPIALN